MKTPLSTNKSGLTCKQRIRLKVANDPTTKADERAFFKKWGEWPDAYLKKSRR